MKPATELEDEKVYCGNCGKPVEVTKLHGFSMICPHCRSII